MLSNKFLAVSGASEPTDAQFNYVTMLLHGDGTNGAQNNTFVDSSSNNFTITRNGNTTQGSFSPYGSNWSAYFNYGTSSYLSFASNADFGVGTGDFTIECWVYPTAAWATAGNYNPLVYVSGTGLYFGKNDAGFGLRQSGTANIISYGTDPALNTWTHVAVVRSGTTVTMYYNGVSVATATSSANFSAGTLQVSYDGYQYMPACYLSNLRLVKGTAVYAGAFTPSTTPLTAVSGTSLLICQSNRFIDNSASPKTVTVSGDTSVQRFNPFGTSTAYSTATIGGSGYFDGTGDYLQIADSSALNLGSSSYTMECWVYPKSFAADFELFTYKWYNASQGPYTGTRQIALVSYGGLVTAYFADAGNNLNASIALKLNSWNHVALVRNGFVITLYINGVSAATTSYSGTYGSANYPTVWGGGYDGGSAFYSLPGYLTDFRVVIGSAVYTSAFTPPTTPLTAISGTAILSSMTNGAIYDNAMMNDLETVGNAQISTSVKKYGTGSLAFDGSGDWLQVANTPNLRLGGDFTIEFWVYQNTLTGYQTAYSFGYVQASSILIQTSNGTGKWDVYIGGVLAASDTGPSVSTNTWYHIAVVRAGSTVTIYRNGSSVGSGTSATAIDQALYEGTIGTGGAFYLNGYMDDFRITKGYARYTANFTPPTSALADKSSS